MNLRVKVLVLLLAQSIWALSLHVSTLTTEGSTGGRTEYYVAANGSDAYRDTSCAASYIAATAGGSTSAWRLCAGAKM